MHIKIARAIGLGDKREIDQKLGKLIKAYPLDQFAKLQEILELDNWEFGRLILDHGTVTELLIFTGQLEVDRDDYLVAVFNKNPVSHEKMQEWLWRACKGKTIPTTVLNALSVFINLRSFDFNQRWQWDLFKLKPSEHGVILLELFLEARNSDAVKLLIKLMREKKVTLTKLIDIGNFPEAHRGKVPLTEYIFMKDLNSLLFDCLTRSSAE